MVQPYQDRITSWGVFERDGNRFVAGTRSNGDPVRTSAVTEMDPAGRWVKTRSGSIYQLHGMDPVMGLAAYAAVSPSEAAEARIPSSSLVRKDPPAVIDNWSVGTNIDGDLLVRGMDVDSKRHLTAYKVVEFSPDGSLIRTDAGEIFGLGTPDRGMQRSPVHRSQAGFSDVVEGVVRWDRTAVSSMLAFVQGVPEPANEGPDAHEGFRANLPSIGRGYERTSAAPGRISFDTGLRNPPLDASKPVFGHYVTLPKDPAEREAMLTRTLPTLLETLGGLDGGSRIQVSVPGTVARLASNVDSIVIHFQDAGMRDGIVAAVRSAGIRSLDRKAMGRPEFGVETPTASNSEIVARSALKAIQNDPYKTIVDMAYGRGDRDAIARVVSQVLSEVVQHREMKLAAYMAPANAPVVSASMDVAPSPDDAPRMSMR
jgi:hypothetical protein